jgi:hypothetical protein
VLRAGVLWRARDAAECGKRAQSCIEAHVVPKK